MPLEIHAPQFFAAPQAKIDGFPAAITTDLAIDNDLSDKGTGVGSDKPWSQEEIEIAAARTTLRVEADRRH
jgi:hypothetical protein